MEKIAKGELDQLYARALKDRMVTDLGIKDKGLYRAAEDDRLFYIDFFEGFFVLEDRGDIYSLRFSVENDLAEYYGSFESDDLSSESTEMAFRRRVLEMGVREMMEELDKPAVMEIAYSSKHPLLLSVSRIFQRAGFGCEINRIRLRLNTEDMPEPMSEAPVHLIELGPEDAKTALGSIKDSFDPIRGSLPLEEDLRIAAAEKRLMASISPEGEVLAVNYLSKRGSSSEISHICVAENERRKGIGEALIRAVFDDQSCKSLRLWVNAENRSARSFYSGLGFKDDGWRSDLLIYRVLTPMQKLIMRKLG